MEKDLSQLNPQEDRSRGLEGIRNLKVYAPLV